MKSCQESCQDMFTLIAASLSGRKWWRETSRTMTDRRTTNKLIYSKVSSTL